jgi:Divergent InlB B-repeat domain
MAVGKVPAGRALAAIAFTIVAFLAWGASARADAPANDDFANATALAETPFAVSGSNAGATKEAGEPDHAGNPGGHSVWFSWTPGTTGWVGIKSVGCFSSIDSLVAVYTGPAVNSLTPVASNASPFQSNCFNEAQPAEFEAVAGTTYMIAVDGRDGAEGSFELAFTGPPANDDFADATVVAPNPPQAVFSTTRLATKQAGEPDHAGNPGGHSVWFSWTPQKTEPVRIYTCSSFDDFDSVLAVYTGSELASLTEVASNDEAADPIMFPGCATANSEVVIHAVAGTTYRIAVDGADGKVGRFNLNFQGRPANDDFAAAQTVTPNYFTLGSAEGTTRFATKEAGEPDHAGNPGGHSVWFAWTAPSSGPVRISTCGVEGEMDTLLAVYTGSELATASLVAANDDGPRPRCGNRDSEIDLAAVAGITYRIAVDGKDGVEHRFSLAIEAPPANDDFAQAQVLPDTPTVSISGSNALASKQPGEPNHAGNPGGSSVWYSWTAPESGPIVISACPYFESSPDTLLAVYTGSSLTGLTPIAAGDDSPSGCQEVASEATLDAVAGTTYRIAVDSKGDGGGIFSLDIKGKPANDDFAAPQELAPGPAMSGGSTLFATKQPGEPDHAGNPGGHSLWFSWTPTESGPVDLYACGRRPGIDTLLAVYTGSAVDALTPVAANDDTGPILQNETCNEASGNSEVVFEAAAGTTYRIAVDTKDSEGHFSLGLETAPANDDFANAQQLYPGMPTFSSGLTKLASKQVGEPDHAGNPGGRSVWFAWTARSSGPVSVQTCTRGWQSDTLLAVYTGSAVDSLTPVAAADDGQTRKGCRSTDSVAEFSAESGQTYMIAVDAKGAGGGFQLIVEGAAANDDFAAAQPLGGRLPQTWGFLSNRYATKQAGEPDHAGEAGGSSVWFKWTAPRDGTVDVDTCESDFDTVLAVYTGSAPAGLTAVASNDDGSRSCAPGSSVSFEAVANTTYRIAVDGKAGAQGTFELNLDQQPANDAFEAAAVIPGRPGWYWPGSNFLATKQSGEPDHEGDAGGHSVWFSWTPARSWEIELDVCSLKLEPLIGVYTGSAVGDLTPVATSDAGAGECSEGGRSVGFTTVPGTTYHFAIDGAGGDQGHFLLHLRAPHLLPNTLSVATSGDGGGMVRSSLAGIDCSASCSHDFEEGAAIVLTATPVPGSTFAGWSGGGCSGTAPCQLALDADTVVTATFQQVDGGGGGGPDQGGGSPESGQQPPTTAPTSPPAVSPPAAKPVKCKRGFRKKRMHGKARCVKKKKHHRPHR